MQEQGNTPNVAHDVPGTAVGAQATRQCIAVMEGVLAGTYGLHLNEQSHSRLIADLRAAIEVAKAQSEGTLDRLRDQANKA